MLTEAELYRRLYRIRRFEETVLDAFPKGAFYGTTHTYLGQEANAVGVLSHLNEGDIVFSNHRCHGHFIAYGGDLRSLFAELMGKSTGVCAGLGGSQHLHWKDFYSNGVLGSTAPIAVGTALAEKSKNSPAVAVLFLGDGALGEGVVYESLNIASLWRAPILFVIENNHIAQTTPLELALAGDIPGRFAAFDIPVRELDSSDVQDISLAAQDEFDALRNQPGPRALVLHTARFGPHSKGDDTRDAAYVAQLRAERDPLAIQAARLPAKERQAIESEIDAQVAADYAQSLADPPATSGVQRPMSIVATPDVGRRTSDAPSPTVLEALNRSLHEAFAEDPRVYLIGEDLLDPYGGAFKVSRGLSSKYPQRVWTSPVSEAAIVGVGAGLALRGLRPVVELMFGDFSTLAADQIINSIAKFSGMYNGAASVPLVIRTPMGGRRGYGPTHSQTLEKLYLGVPGLNVLAINALSDPGQVLKGAILHSQQPVLFIENKVLYPRPVLDATALADFEIGVHAGGYAPTHTLRLKGAPAPRLTLAAYGYMAELAREALLRLAFEHELFCELVVPTQLAPFPAGGGLPPAMVASLARSTRLLTIEEGTYSLGWGAELVARAAQQLGSRLQAAARVAAAEAPIPAARNLEEAALPGVEHILAAAREMV